VSVTLAYPSLHFIIVAFVMPSVPHMTTAQRLAISFADRFLWKRASEKPPDATNAR
jgi:hypothetical protein